MKIVLIIVAIIFYFSLGTCFAAVNEAEKYETTGQYGLEIKYILFWPIFILTKLVTQIYSKIFS